MTTSQRHTPVIVLVGRPNVGKSTLFNLLTRSKDALVADYPGLTHDRQYGLIQHHNQLNGVLIDAPGLTQPPSTSQRLTDTPSLKQQKQQQTERAIDEADLLVWLLDARTGLTTLDLELSAYFRRFHKPLIVAVNKIDGLDPLSILTDFYTLGWTHTLGVAVTQSQGIPLLLTTIKQCLTANNSHSKAPENHAPSPLPDTSSDRCKVAIIGRPNTGKSTLINQLVRQPRLVVDAQAGTTRDSIEITLDYRGHAYTLIDTAGIRRPSKVGPLVEKYSVAQSLQAIDQADVVILLINARDGITEQDLRLLHLASQRARGLVIAINQWDHLSDEQRLMIQHHLKHKLRFIHALQVHCISGLYKQGLGPLFQSVRTAFRSIRQPFPTSQLSTILEHATTQHPPYKSKNRLIKLRYAHLGSRHPLKIIIHGKRAEQLDSSYQRYLTKYFQNALKLRGTPVNLLFRNT